MEQKVEKTKQDVIETKELQEGVQEIASRVKIQKEDTATLIARSQELTEKAVKITKADTVSLKKEVSELTSALAKKTEPKATEAAEQLKALPEIKEKTQDIQPKDTIKIKTKEGNIVRTAEVITIKENGIVAEVKADKGVPGSIALYPFKDFSFVPQKPPTEKKALAEYRARRVSAEIAPSEKIKSKKKPVKEPQKPTISKKEPVEKKTQIASKEDIDKEFAIEAHHNMSHFPEKGGERSRQEYADTVNEMYEDLKEKATTPEQLAIVEEEMLKFKERYLKAYNTFLSAKSRTASSMVVGPARFPVAKNRERMEMEMRRYDELVDLEKKARASIEKKLKAQSIEERGGEKIVADEELTQMQEKLDSMKEANKIMRSKKLTFDEKMDEIAKLPSLGDSIEYYTQRNEKFEGFPSFSTTNLRNKIKSRESKKTKTEKREAKAPVEHISDFEGGKVVRNNELDRIQILFDEKPDADMIQNLKKSGWRWSPKNNAWQRQATQNAIRSAGQILKDKRKAPKTPKFKLDETFKGFEDISTVILEKLTEKTTVSSQFISDLTKTGDLKQAERDLIRETLEEMPEGKINVQEFADKVRVKLLPLKTIHPTPRYESFTLPSNLRGDVADYTERIYESPIKTSAGVIHFEGETKNYFAHTRIEDMADGVTRRVDEVQGDLMQKGRLKEEYGFFKGLTAGESKADYLKRVKKREKEVTKLQPYRNTWSERIIREEIKRAAQDGKTKLQFPTGETAVKIEKLGGSGMHRWRIMVSDTQAGDILTPETIKVGEVLHDLQGGIADAIQSGRGGWIITEVLEDGKFKAVPKGAIDAIIKQHKRTLEQAITDVSSDIQEQFDISGKVDTSNPIYRFYEKDIQKYLKRIHPEMKRITDAQGVEWFEIAPKREEGKKPVLAFKKDGEVEEYGRKEVVTFLDDFKKRLKVDFAVHFVDSIIAGKSVDFYKKAKILTAYGVTVGDAIAFANKLAIYTAEHEVVHLTLDNLHKIQAFHGMSREQILMTQSEKMRNEAAQLREKAKETTNKEEALELEERAKKLDLEYNTKNAGKIEEQLALDFEAYMKDKHAPKGIVRRFFVLLKKQLLDFAKLIKITKGNVIRNYFDVLAEGKSIGTEVVRLQDQGIIKSFLKEGVLDFGLDPEASFKFESARVSALKTELKDLQQTLHLINTGQRKASAPATKQLVKKQAVLIGKIKKLESVKFKLKDPLHQEARKYTSAEEFVDDIYKQKISKGNDTTILWRGEGNNIESQFTISQIDRGIPETGDTLSFSTNKITAQEYGKALPYITNDKIKIFDDIISTAKLTGELRTNRYSEKIVNHYKKLGYDAYTIGTDEVVLINKDMVKKLTKSQLTDIWKESQGIQRPKFKLNKELYSEASKKTASIFEQSKDQKVIGAKGDMTFELGSFGRKHQLRKVAEKKQDRFQVKELSETIDNVVAIYKASDDSKSYRSDNIVHIAEMPSGETRVVYTRLNRNGAEEILSWHKLPETKKSNYIKKLNSFGIPSRTRTDSVALEERGFIQLTDRDIKSVSEEQEVVKRRRDIKFKLTEESDADIKKLKKEYNEIGTKQTKLEDNIQKHKQAINSRMTDYVPTQEEFVAMSEEEQNFEINRIENEAVEYEQLNQAQQMARDIAEGRKKIRVGMDTKKELQEGLGKSLYMRTMRKDPTLPTFDEVTESVRETMPDITTSELLENINEEVGKYLERKTVLVETRNQLRKLRRKISQGKTETKENKAALREVSRKLKIQRQFLERRDLYVARVYKLGEKAAIQKVSRRRKAVNDIQEAYGISDAKKKEIIGSRYVHLMAEEEFNNFLVELTNRAEVESGRVSAIQSVKAILLQKQYQKADNLRLALGLPTVERMNEKQANRFIDALVQYEFEDVFLSKRMIETSERTSFGKIVTERELAVAIKRDTDLTTKDLEIANLPWLAGFANGLRLERHSNLMKYVTDSLITVEIETERQFLQHRKKIDELAKAA
ncbi:MAG: hypothetical protein KAS04_05300, partial [Candidatus Aenigmarchaeota archaeon]|nr:hypothetical protein [Candidatus Aenigmarchaeota archaeon]